MGTVKQLDVISRMVTVEQLANILGCTPNAVRMKEKRGIIKRIETRERKVLFNLKEALNSLGYDRAMAS